ncbi:MAG: 2-amino-4-hydroxy-6-hydroxymethyldihydropteridine diphosphokinase [Candidatus Hydrogenedentes bacterium]|nr:2-amino-4-hydroxy-6-hydroxymethyldihydropteridine diphosphokinase [Candidatus Hydrogenedentota bacterium]
MAREPEAGALIAIGSNIAPAENVPRALALLRDRVAIAAVSSFYWSDPVGAADQPRFLNGACRVRTALAPRELKFGVLRAIEDALGRVRTADKYAPREIDLDIAVFGEWNVDEDGLRLPDPDIRRRTFLAIPLAEVAPDWVVPGAGATLSEIADGMPRSGLELDAELTARCRQAAMEELEP